MKFLLNSISKADPTRTAGIRRRFLTDVNRRFAALKKAVRMSIIDNNCFGIRTPIRANQPAPPNAFAFELDVRKVADFIKWLERLQEAGLLQRIIRPGSRAGYQASWTDIYIDSAYQQGIRRARAEMRKAGMPSDFYGDAPLGGAAIQAAFGMAIHADAVGLLYMRTFEDLKTVMAVMNAEVRRTIAEGLRTGIARGIAEGRSVEYVTRQLAGDVVAGIDKIGLTRARLIARTEIVRAHHLATINEYRRADEDMKVTVKAEFVTARDDRVCDICAEFEGKIFTLDEIEGLIPRHPNCRCAAVPNVEAISANVRRIRRFRQFRIRRAA